MINVQAAVLLKALAEILVDKGLIKKREFPKTINLLEVHQFSTMGYCSL